MFFFRSSNLVEAEPEVDLQPIVVERGVRASFIDLWRIELVLAGHFLREILLTPAGDLGCFRAVQPYWLRMLPASLSTSVSDMSEMEEVTRAKALRPSLASSRSGSI